MQKFGNNQIKRVTLNFSNSINSKINWDGKCCYYSAIDENEEITKINNGVLDFSESILTGTDRENWWTPKEKMLKLSELERETSISIDGSGFGLTFRPNEVYIDTSYAKPVKLEKID